MGMLQKRKKIIPYLVAFSVFILVIIGLPALLVLPFSEGKSAAYEEAKPQDQQKVTQELTSDISIPVYRTNEKKVENIPLEDYVVGVVASEMPAEFELEALKAQALTARTFVIRQLLNPVDLNLPNGAVVTDTVMFQVYKSDEELRQLWKADYDWKKKKITQAVYETQGRIITYEGEPIEASFFSTSNGFTENSEDYWKKALPYLKSVESSWDEESPKFHAQKVIPITEVESKLGVQIAGNNEIGNAAVRTEGNRISTLEINGKTFTGRKIREELDLNSSDFSMKLQGDSVVFDTKGFGHGVGMSQYGANGMALEGKNFQEIIQHYYQGVQISETQSYASKITAKKD
jgi:stage II sporulation protein D